MFVATFNQGGTLLRKLTDILKDHINEAVLNITEGGISLQSMDTSHVALVDILIYPDAIDSYQCNDYYKLGINFETLGKILKTNTNSKCTLKYDPDKNPEVLCIKFEGKSKSRYSMKLIEIDTELLEIPESIEHDYQQEIDSLELQKVFKDLSIFSDDVTINRKHENETELNSGGSFVTFSSKGASTNVVMDIKVKEITTNVETETEKENMYSLKYLTWFSRGATIATNVTLGFDEKYPLLMQFEQDDVRIKFFVGGKVK